jgi:hypothetical protein
MDMKTSLPRVAAAPTAALTAALTALLLALAACSSGSSDDSSSSGSAARVADSNSDSDSDSSARAPVAGADRDEPVDLKAPALEEPSIISTGSVSLTADDVAKARAHVRQVAAAYAGTVTDEETTTADDKRMGYARLVLRVPARSFSPAMTDLEHVGGLVDSNTTSQDVSTRVIDLDERVKAARASIDRITVLLGRAEKIGDIMAIEAQLSRREADLNSLLRQQAHLADQTSLSTITVGIDRPAPAHVRESSGTGFVAGFDGGWRALRGFTTGVATVAGTALPWLPVTLLVGVPAWLFLRRLRMVGQQAEKA